MSNSWNKLTNMVNALFVPSFALLANYDSSLPNLGVTMGANLLSHASLTAKVGGNEILGGKLATFVSKSKSLNTDHVRFIEARCQGAGLLNRLHYIKLEISRLNEVMANSPSPKDMAHYNKELAARMVALQSANRRLKKVDALLLKLSAKIDAALTKIIAKLTVSHQAQEQKAAEKAAKVEAARKAKEAKAEDARRAKAAKVEAARKAKEAKVEEARKAKALKVEEARKVKATKAAEARAEARKAKPVAKKAVKPVKGSAPAVKDVKAS